MKTCGKCGATTETSPFTILWADPDDGSAGGTWGRDLLCKECATKAEQGQDAEILQIERGF